MFVTIWMCTHEWSLISIRATAFTFETCHQPLSCLSAFTRSTIVRSLRLPRTGTLIRIRSTASDGVSRASRSASSAAGGSIRSAVSLSIAMARVCHEYRHGRPSRSARRRRRSAPEPADGLLPADPRDPAFHLVLPLDDRGVRRRDPQLVRPAVRRSAAGGLPPFSLGLHPLRRSPGRLPLSRSRSVPGLPRRGGNVRRRGATARRAAAAGALEDVPAPDPRRAGLRDRHVPRRRGRHLRERFLPRQRWTVPRPELRRRPRG